MAEAHLSSTAAAEAAPGSAAAPRDMQRMVRESPATGVTMVVHSGDFDKMMAAFIIATGAAASGKQVTMFFTFWGLNAVKNGRRMPGKSLLERLVARMTPANPDDAPCSRFNMLGMAPCFFRRLMKRNNVMPLGEMVTTAQELGVRLVACQMSMGIMGIREAELIDDIDYGGVATYLCDAGNSGLNLFI
jgi:peroxiredoxin family protein